ncbi:Zinc-ribbon domain-containing protein [uncultured Thiomicrorhabdus sp.]
MKRFYCSCSKEVGFHDHVCKNCGRDLVYDPVLGTILSGELINTDCFIVHTPDGQKNRQLIACDNRHTTVACNWALVPEDQENDCECISCRSTRSIPDQEGTDKNPTRWYKLERSKRQLMQTLIDLKAIDATQPELYEDLEFDFLEDKRSNPDLELEHVLSGHYDGLITINAAEADEGFLHTMKEQMQERYRTLLGHFRHEIGHYFWLKFFHNEEMRKKFRKVFGDERDDYSKALKRYYKSGNQSHWRSRFITPYASSHPHEDWAETWAHYMHIVDTLQTAHSYGLSDYEPHKNSFDQWFVEWGRVTQVMNALNRSMGVAEPYPFKVSDIVEGKLRFIDEMICLYALNIKSPSQRKPKKVSVKSKKTTKENRNKSK